MRYLPILAAGLLAVETAAIACSCINTDDPAELQRFARDAAEGAVAVVEVEAHTAYQPGGMGEHMQVLRTLAGTAPAQFMIERGPNPSSASCDILYSPGQRDTVILYPATTANAAMPVYRTSGLCSQHLLEKPLYRDTLIDAIGTADPAVAGERG